MKIRFQNQTSVAWCIRTERLTVWNSALADRSKDRQ